MGWFVRVDRFADTHLCFSQEGGVSCGLASVKMVVFKVNKFRVRASSRISEARIEQAYLRYETDVAAFRREGALSSALTSTLNDLGIGHWSLASPAANRIADFLIDRLEGFPMILFVQWGAGAHYVVADELHHIPLTDAYWACVCDPGDGNVHVTRLHRGHPIAYEGRRAVGVNFWGEPENNYGAGAVIRGTVTSVIHCDTRPPWIAS